MEDDAKKKKTIGKAEKMQLVFPPPGPLPLLFAHTPCAVCNTPQKWFFNIGAETQRASYMAKELFTNEAKKW